jgi:hypothetical protein
MISLIRLLMLVFSKQTFEDFLSEKANEIIEYVESKTTKSLKKKKVSS